MKTDMDSKTTERLSTASVSDVRGRFSWENALTHALAAGENISSYVSTYERFAGDYQLIAEQLWNGGPVQTSTRNFVFGGPTGSSMPLARAHAEYIKLVRSVSDGKVFDRLNVVADRYLVPHNPSLLEIWNFNRQIGSIPNGKTLRIQAPGHSGSIGQTTTG